MHRAAENGHVATIRALAELGASVNAGINMVSKKRVTPLYSAAIKDNGGAIRTLVELGANNNIGDKDGVKPIHAAAIRGCDSAIRALVELGGDVNKLSPL
jgi:ankyrin repeat protein